MEKRMCAICQKELKPRKYTLKGKVVYNITNKKFCSEKCRGIGSKKLVKILYECPCSHPKKHNHHFDYNRISEVIRLCPPCHGREHKRLRAIGAQPLWNSMDSMNIKIPYT